MRLTAAFLVAAGLSLGLATTSHAQVVVGTNPWGGVGVSVGSYYNSYYGPGIGYTAVPGATFYSSGYTGIAPAAVGVGPVVGYGYAPYRVTTYSYPVYGYRRGLFGRYRGGWMW